MKTIFILLFPCIVALSSAAQTTDSVSAPRSRITASEFDQLIKTVRNQAIDSVKVRFLKNTFINTRAQYSTAQIRKLLSEIPKDSGKLAVARSAYDRVYDQDKFVQLADLFNSDTYRSEFTLWAQNPND